ncbi:hypothetical protein RSJ42_13205 [Methanosarcina hadiensis]
MSSVRTYADRTMQLIVNARIKGSFKLLLWTVSFFSACEARAV